MLWDDFETYLRQEEIIKAVFKLKKCPPWADPTIFVPGSHFVCVEYCEHDSLTMRCLTNNAQICAGAGYFDFVGMQTVVCKRPEGVGL